ncbi:MAG TPA: DNA repair protein RadA [Fibrobacteraceae bacterium]|nr:DNA repair protein RadA [Fibrobacteraceae bacterium]
MAKKAESEFICKACGAVSKKWTGKCLACGTWSSLEERQVETSQPLRGLGASLANGSSARPLADIASEDAKRLSTGNTELDRTLGGGLAPGSLILLGGDPGIGKSTLVLQTLATLAAAGVQTLYVTGEESAVQVKLRSERLQVSGSQLLLLCETNLRRVTEEAKRLQPEVMVVDSIQTVYREDLPGTPGSLNQLRECTLELMVFAKTHHCVIFLVGHVTKEGQIAGPRTLEHMVDTVAYFEGDRNHQYRILRTIKNRFGATDEIGVFEMTGHGLVPVENPSRIFLNPIVQAHAGSVVSCTLEGSRAMLFEIQALVNSTNYAVAQRVAAGVDPKRLTIILALLEKFAGVSVGASDVFVSVAGGLRVDDPATDLALALAIAGNHLSLRLPAQSIAIGELGLSGEVRGVAQLELRVKEAHRLGFVNMIVPCEGRLPSIDEVQIYRVERLDQALEWVRNATT